RSMTRSHSELRASTAQPEPEQRGAAGQLGLSLRMAVTGALGIGYEVLVVRALSQIASNTVYTFALALAVYLLGTAFGGALHVLLAREQNMLLGSARLSEQDRRGSNSLRDKLLAATAAACLLGALTLGF